MQCKCCTEIILYTLTLLLRSPSVVYLIFLPVVPGMAVGLCVGNGCPVIEPVIIRIKAVILVQGLFYKSFLPVVSGRAVGLCVGNGCPVNEPVIIRIRAVVLVQGLHYKSFFKALEALQKTK